MTKHRLYIVEGLPCSGKSTVSKYIADLLAAQNISVLYYDEGSGDHPADYEHHSFISADAMCGFSAEERQKIVAVGEPYGEGLVVDLSEFDDLLSEKLMRYKIYDLLPWETEKPIMLNKWWTFCTNADRNTVYVFNCCFLQNPMCETMMRFGFDKEVSYQYISEIAKIIEPLSPAVVYLKNDNIGEIIRQTAAQRGDWLDAVISYHINGGYGKSISAEGFDGYISCLCERQRRELDILSRLPVKSIVIENAHSDWDSAYGIITSDLKSELSDFAVTCTVRGYPRV